MASPIQIILSVSKNIYVKFNENELLQELVDRLSSVNPPKR